MRIARYAGESGARLGIVEGELLHPLSDDTTLETILSKPVTRRGDLPTAPPIELAAVRLLAPIEPPAVRDFVAFEQHVEGMALRQGPQGKVSEAWYEAPAFYFSNPNSIVASGDDVEIPPGCKAFDFELEVAAVIGKPGRDLTLETAEQHIGGYTILNDWSARDLQGFDRRLGMGWAKGKDSASTLGPWIVTADELESSRNDAGRLDLAMDASLNGAEIGHDSLASSAWSFAQMLVYASRGTWLKTGDVIGSGTCGSGCLAEFWGRAGKIEPPALKPGDEVTLTVQGIGTITNKVVAGVEPLPYGEPVRR